MSSTRPRPSARTPAAARPLAVTLLLAAGCAPRSALPPAPSLFPGADTVRAETLAPGVRHVYAWLPEGPWAVHLVEVDGSLCAPDLAARKAGPPLDARATTSALGAGALAAVNADFFLIPRGTTVGGHVSGGEVRAGPGTRPLWAVDARGGFGAGVATLEGRAWTGTDTAAVVQVNRPGEAERHHPVRPGLILFGPWYGPEAPADTSGPTLAIRRLEGSAGSAGRGIVEAVRPRAARVGAVAGAPLDDGRVAIQARGPRARAWLAMRAPGDTVAWRVAVPAPGTGRPAVEAVGGFPLLLAGGRGVLAAQEGVIPSFGPTRHPRTAVAWDAPGNRFFLVVVDGRQPPWSAGMTLSELEALLLRLGATDGINLDGGGSTAMAIRGRVVNRPSDAEGERPVGDALLLRGCRAP